VNVKNTSLLTSPAIRETPELKGYSDAVFWRDGRNDWGVQLAIGPRFASLVTGSSNADRQQPVTVPAQRLRESVLVDKCDPRHVFRALNEDKAVVSIGTIAAILATQPQDHDWMSFVAFVQPPLAIVYPVSFRWRHGLGWAAGATPMTVPFPWYGDDRVVYPFLD